ncbi:type II toxin-antitoxin system RelE/ParE family toxin [Candidatus Daviesbacteria bacterium]|nr:type II toxin-antitoxin system RelE/ParE family toxin [Candidatus Daviesbacteria bacterium]
MFQVNFSKSAIKSLKKFPLKDQIRIKKVSEKIKQDPFALDIKKLEPPHKTSHRIRTGSYRIFLDIDTTTKIILIVEIERRTTQTY